MSNYQIATPEQLVLVPNARCSCTNDNDLLRRVNEVFGGQGDVMPWFVDMWDLIHAHNYRLITLLDGWWEDGYLNNRWNVVGQGEL